jgi:hypothetical protein
MPARGISLWIVQYFVELVRGQTSNVSGCRRCSEIATEGYSAHFVFAVSVSVQGIARKVKSRPRQTMWKLEVMKGMHSVTHTVITSVHVCGLQ